MNNQILYFEIQHFDIAFDFILEISSGNTIFDLIVILFWS